MQVALGIDPDLEFRDIEDGDLYSHVFPKDTRGRVRGLGLLPHSCKTIDIARQSARTQEISEENIVLRASNAELAARLDIQDAKISAMQAQWEAQFNSANQSCIAGQTQALPNNLSQPEASVQSPLRRRPIPDARSDALAQIGRAHV